MILTLAEWKAQEGPIGEGWNADILQSPDAPQMNNGDAFGWVKGSFGVFEANAASAVGPVRVSTLIFLPMGFRVAIFATPEIAAEAGDIALPLGDWEKLNPRVVPLKKWQDIFARVQDAWAAALIVQTPITIGGICIYGKSEDGGQVVMHRPAIHPVNPTKQ